MNTNWYVLRVSLGKERKVEERLNLRINMGHLPGLVRFLCPVEKEYYTVKGKKHIRDRVIYGGYLYVESEGVIDKEVVDTIKNDMDVKGFLGGDNPTRLSPSDVDRIIKDEVLQERIASKQVEIIAGTKVHINEGPFLGFTGDVHEVFEDSGKAKVIVKIFGRETLVDISLTQIQKHD